MLHRSTSCLPRLFVELEHFPCVGIDHRQQDNRSIAEIFSDLPSPVLGPTVNGIVHRVVSGDAIWGLRTPLYGYQRHSVAVMLHRESSTGPVPDPLYIPVSSMSGTCFYIQPSTMTVLRERPMYSPSQAGLLCEELGMFASSVEA